MANVARASGGRWRLTMTVRRRRERWFCRTGYWQREFGGDPGAAGSVLLAVAAIANSVPAYRAIRIDPADALRNS